MKKSIKLIILSFSLALSMQASAILITSEPILTNPTSTDNLWTYSYLGTNSYITSSRFYATSVSQFTSAVEQGYVTGTGHPNPLVTSDYFGISQSEFDYKTTHVFNTFMMSTVDQVLNFGFGGDDGHSLFLDGVFLAGGGYSISKSVSVSMLANVAYNLTFVGTNYTGPWSFGIGCSPVCADNSLSSAENVLMNAKGEFNTGVPIPEPATLALMGLGLAGIGYKRKVK